MWLRCYLTKHLVKENLQVSAVKFMSSIPQQVLNVEKPQPKIIPNPPQQVKQQKPQTNQASNGSVPTPSPVATASSPPPPSNVISATQVPAQASSPIRAGDSQNGSDVDYSSHRRGSFLASEAYRSPPSISNMRRYDSHSLLSENSIASSRFDISDGALYPEWA